jgi:chemotaxis protein CheX
MCTIFLFRESKFWFQSPSYLVKNVDINRNIGQNSYGGLKMPVTATQNITTLLNGTIEVSKAVIPVPFQLGKPTTGAQFDSNVEIGVIIGLEKDINGTLILQGKETLFGEFGQAMYGMPFEGEMLQSFIGEFGNILAGNIATHLSNKQITIDITPPRVVTEVSISDAKKMISVPLQFEGGNLLVVCAIY